METKRGTPVPTWAAIIATRMPQGTTQRVRANRRLRRVGALAVRPGVYALPDSAEGREALAGAAREVARQRGSALPCVVSWLDPVDESRLRARFEAERVRKRERLLKHIAALERAASSTSRTNTANRQTVHARLARLRKRLDQTAEPAREISQTGMKPSQGSVSANSPYAGRTWVTRKGVLVDRIASAWLILRFIDSMARFRFVKPGEDLPVGALRFDMADAEFGHVGDHCTFETLVDRFCGGDPALRQLAEIVHDLDIRDGKYGRAEAPGLMQVIMGLAATEPDDEMRIVRGGWLFDCLYASLRPGPALRLPKGVLP